jgi:hypothetical protein
VVKGHHHREQVQFEAAERINVVVTGTSVEEPVKRDTAVIVQANKDASAEQIAEMAQSFAVTITAQATEIKRLGADNEALRGENKKLVEANAALQSQLDDFGRKVAVYTANGIGALCLLAAIAAGILTKNLTYVGWCMVGSFLGFGTARVVGHWIFPWVVGVGSVIIVAGVVCVLVMERRKAKRLAVADDVIAAVEEIRGFLKSPPVEVVEEIRKAESTEAAVAVLRRVGERVKRILSDWITEHDGSAAVVDERRRALRLI